MSGIFHAVDSADHFTVLPCAHVVDEAAAEAERPGERAGRVDLAGVRMVDASEDAEEGRLARR